MSMKQDIFVHFFSFTRKPVKYYMQDIISLALDRFSSRDGVLVWHQIFAVPPHSPQSPLSYSCLSVYVSL